MEGYLNLFRSVCTLHQETWAAPTWIGIKKECCHSSNKKFKIKLMARKQGNIDLMLFKKLSYNFHHDKYSTNHYVIWMYCSHYVGNIFILSYNTLMTETKLKEIVRIFFINYSTTWDLLLIMPTFPATRNKIHS